MLVLSISFFDAHTELNNRILSPLYSLLLIFIFIIIEEATTKTQVRIPVIILLASLLISNVVYNGRLWHRHYVEGSGYLSLEWQGSATLLAVKPFTGYIIYTNAPDLIRLYYPGLTSQVRNLPLKTNANTGVANSNYIDDLRGMKTSVDSGEGVILYFDRFKAREYYITEEEVLGMLKNKEIKQLGDGFIIISEV
jgi:hypothetical protein